MRKLYILVIVFFLLFVTNGWVCLIGCEYDISFVLYLAMIICVILQGIMIYVLKSKRVLCLFLMCCFLLFLHFFYYPYFWGAMRDYNNIKLSNDTTFAEIYDYYDDIPSCNSQPCLMLKEGEIGAYYYTFYLNNMDSCEVSFSVWPIDNPQINIYKKTLKAKKYSHNDTIIKDSFMVIVNESNEPIPSYFEIRVDKLDNLSPQIIKRKYLLHQWRR